MVNAGNFGTWNRVLQLRWFSLRTSTQTSQRHLCFHNQLKSGHQSVASLRCFVDKLWVLSTWLLKQMIPGKHSSSNNHGSRKWLYLKRNYYWRDPVFHWSMIVGGRVFMFLSPIATNPWCPSLKASFISDTSEIRKNHKYQRNKNYTKSSSTSYRYNMYIYTYIITLFITTTLYSILMK